jgi:hypothetical protein
MEGIFEELPFCALALSNLLYLDKSNWLSWWMTEREINTTPLKGVLGTDDLRVVRWPRESV